MMRIQGTIHNVNELSRELIITTRTKRWHLVVQRGTFNRFFKYLDVGNALIGEVKMRRAQRNGRPILTLTNIIQIHRPHPRGRIVYYSHQHVQSQTRMFINTLGYKLFLDLEMSMHPYKLDKDFKQEVIQAGYVLTDEHGTILKRYATFIRPTRHQRLTHRTLKFLDLTQADVDQGIAYSAFHHHLLSLIRTHNPAIIVWGMNDALAIRDSADINALPRLPKRARFINLLKLHKNYFGLKDDLGLVNAYKLYGHTLETQRHDALEDAEMTRSIFEGFREHLNGAPNLERTILDKVK